MNAFDITIGQLEYFFLVLFRVSGMMISAPVLGSRSVPHRVKIGLSLAIAIILFPILKTDEFTVYRRTLPFVLVLFREVTIGIFIGYAAMLLFVGVQLAGQLVGVQMGFGMANVIDPQSSLQVPLIAQFQYLLAALIFLCIDGHHWLLQAIAASFKVVSFPEVLSNTNSVPLYPVKAAVHLVEMFGNIFMIAIKIGAPVMVALFLTSVALGILARAVPQINIFILGFPIKIAVGLLSLATSLPLFVHVLQGLFLNMREDISALLSAMSP